MDTLENLRYSKTKWRCCLLVLYILLTANCRGETSHTDKTKTDKLDNNLDSIHCHSCYSSSNESPVENYIGDVVETLSTYADENFNLNKTVVYLERAVESILDKALSNDRFKIIEGVEIKAVQLNSTRADKNDAEGRALFSKYTYEYRLYQKVKDFINTHILSINLPMAAKSFGLNKFFIPILIGGQVLIKSILFAMFLPSILGSFGKMLSKGISHLSATSSQASYPPANADDQTGYNSDNKDFMGYETNQAGTFAYPQDGMYDANDVNELGNVDMSRFGADSQKMGYLPSKNSYYKNQMSATNNYKVFQKIPASSMILSNYDPFYSPLLSRLDGIFARLGLEPSENSVDENIEPCREQLICLMYASPAKFAPYSNLVSAQLSRELNELRRPVSDNPEILRFFKYMKAARRGQEQSDCMYSYPTCTANAPKTHTMVAAYHDINKLVTARKLN
ncbi:protein Osi24 [Anticarsia gemmatalis]|uniref:protein Osi24 n=1 Tax=Anticarsia gemmatalis TaxID=129554 RepID=UPI003F75BF2E